MIENLGGNTVREYIKPELTVREIRVSENLAGKVDLWDDAVWTKFNMLVDGGSPVSDAMANLNPVLQEVQ